MWTADKIYYRNSDNFIRAYQGSSLVWEKPLQNNQVRYTNSTGNPISIDTSVSHWGANLVSNTYDSSGGLLTFDGPVTGVYFKEKSSLVSVIIPSSVTSIETQSFRLCTSLTSVTIPNTVTSIGGQVFSGCRSLTSVTIPNTVTSIGISTFNGCTSLTSVNIPSSLTSIPNGFCYGCSSLSSITIPSSVTSIGFEAFYGCSSLKTVTIPSSVTRIEDGAFNDCRNMERVYVKASTPPTLVYTGAEWFDNEATGRVIIVPQASLNSYKTNNRWSKYNPYIIGDQSVIHYTSSNNSVVTPYRDYEDMWGTGVTLVSNTYINSDGGLIVFSGPVTQIGNEAFMNRSQIETVTIPESVTIIGNKSFYNCNSLESITIPASVTQIVGLTFDNCSSLSEVIVMPTEPPFIGQAGQSDYPTIFDNNAAGRLIKVPSASLNAYYNAGGWRRYNRDIVRQ